MSQEILPVRKQTEIASERAHPLAHLQGGSRSLVRRSDDKNELANVDEKPGANATSIDTINGSNSVVIDNSKHFHEAPTINVLVLADDRRQVASYHPSVSWGPQEVRLGTPVRHREPSDSWFGQLASLLIAFVCIVTLFAVIALAFKSSSSPTVVVAPTAVPARPEPGGFDDFLNSSNRRN